MAIVGSCVVSLCCLTFPVFSAGGVGGGDVSEAVVGNVVLASGISVQVLLRSPVIFGVGVGDYCRCAAAAAQFLVEDDAVDPECGDGGICRGSAGRERQWDSLPLGS